MTKELKKQITKKDLFSYLEDLRKSNQKYDIIFLDDNFVNIEKSFTIPSLNIFQKKIDLLKDKINEEGIISFNLIGKSKNYYEQVKNIIKSKNFFILKDEKDYCNGYFILAKNADIINNAKRNKNKKKIFKSEINLNVEKFINIFLSKNQSE